MGSVSSLGRSAIWTRCCATGLVLLVIGDVASIELGVVDALAGDAGLCGMGDNAGRSKPPENKSAFTSLFSDVINGYHDVLTLKPSSHITSKFASIM